MTSKNEKPRRVTRAALEEKLEELPKPQMVLCVPGLDGQFYPLSSAENFNKRHANFSAVLDALIKETFPETTSYIFGYEVPVLNEAGKGHSQVASMTNGQMQSKLIVTGNLLGIVKGEAQAYTERIGDLAITGYNAVMKSKNKL